MRIHVRPLGLFVAVAAVSGLSLASETAQLTFAEGYSSAATDKPVDLSYRRFTIHSKPCEGLETPARLAATPERVTLKIGERFRLSDVIVGGYDEAGNFLPSLPIGATLESLPHVVQLESDHNRSFVLIARGEGQGSAFFTASCSGKSLQAKITFTVLK